MLNTSNFLGFFFPQNTFTSLYVKLREYLEDNKLIPNIVIQDIHSVHTTIYYFEKSISLTDKIAIDTYIQATHSRYPNLSLIVNSFAYFTNDNEKQVLYLVPKNDVLYQLNQELALEFKRINILDNQFLFTPHISFLKIYNSTLYEEHAPAIESIVNAFLTEAKLTSVHCDLRLYSAFSQFKPELQLPILM